MAPAAHSRKAVVSMTKCSLSPTAGKQIASHLPGRKPRVRGRDRTVHVDFWHHLGRILHFWQNLAQLGGVKPVAFLPRAREELEIICSARNQEIYGDAPCWLTMSQSKRSVAP
jgi:hypothetical protein